MITEYTMITEYRGTPAGKATLLRAVRGCACAGALIRVADGSLSPGRAPRVGFANTERSD